MLKITDTSGYEHTFHPDLDHWRMDEHLRTLVRDDSPLRQFEALYLLTELLSAYLEDVKPTSYRARYRQEEKEEKVASRKTESLVAKMLLGSRKTERWFIKMIWSIAEVGGLIRVLFFWESPCAFYQHKATEMLAYLCADTSIATMLCTLQPGLISILLKHLGVDSSIKVWSAAVLMQVASHVQCHKFFAHTEPRTRKAKEKEEKEEEEEEEEDEEEEFKVILLKEKQQEQQENENEEEEVGEGHELAFASGQMLAHLSTPVFYANLEPTLRKCREHGVDSTRVRSIAGQGICRDGLLLVCFLFLAMNPNKQWARRALVHARVAKWSPRSNIVQPGVNARDWILSLLLLFPFPHLDDVEEKAPKIDPKRKKKKKKRGKKQEPTKAKEAKKEEEEKEEDKKEEKREKRGETRENECFYLMAEADFQMVLIVSLSLLKWCVYLDDYSWELASNNEALRIRLEALSARLHLFPSTLRSTMTALNHILYGVGTERSARIFRPYSIPGYNRIQGLIPDPRFCSFTQCENQLVMDLPRVTCPGTACKLVQYCSRDCCNKHQLEHSYFCGHV